MKKYILMAKLLVIMAGSVVDLKLIIHTNEKGFKKIEENPFRDYLDDFGRVVYFKANVYLTEIKKKYKDCAY